MKPLIAQTIADEKLPGCVVAVGRHGTVKGLKAHGSRQSRPEIEPTTAVVNPGGIHNGKRIASRRSSASTA